MGSPPTQQCSPVTPLPKFNSFGTQKEADSITFSNIEKNVTRIEFSKQDRRKSATPSMIHNNDIHQKSKHRAVLKNGKCNVYPRKVPTCKFVKDIFTTLVDLQWRWTILIVIHGFFISWTTFAVLWWFVAYFHGDFEHEHLPMNQKAANWTPCLLEIYDFTSCLLFSIETQHTTGYGQRTPTEQCPDAILLMCIQNVIGLAIEAFFIGIVFAKLTRPKLRTQTIRFSENAVISERDNVLCLMFRIGDLQRKSCIIEAKIKAQLIRQKNTPVGEFHHTKLFLSADDCESDLFLIWPMTIVHRINKKSPLFNISANDLAKEHFEIVVTLEGTIESTDQKTQARTSYISEEILWGRKFEPIISFDRRNLSKTRGYLVDYSKFDETVVIDTPLCSSAQL